VNEIRKVVDLIRDCLERDNKVITFGVGGNAANAMHFAAELSGKFEQHEQPLSCICLCDNPCILTAITNDFGWDHVFERQILGIGKPGDVVVAFSISTKGQYLINAHSASKQRGCSFVLICGEYTREFLPDVLMEIGSSDTLGVQEEQLRLLHEICREVKEFARDRSLQV